MHATNRKIAWELLNSMVPQPSKVEAELYRIAHIYRSGLTDKEYKFLMQRIKVQQEETQQLVKLKDRLKRTLNGRGK